MFFFFPASFFLRKWPVKSRIWEGVSIFGVTILKTFSMALAASGGMSFVRAIPVRPFSSGP